MGEIKANCGLQASMIKISELYLQIVTLFVKKSLKRTSEKFTLRGKKGKVVYVFQITNFNSAIEQVLGE